MSWLFTQVWLWSLAAFALGSLLTWWLFVRPLRRELRELAPAEEPEEAWGPAEEAPLDLLRDPEESVRTDDELEFVRGPEEPTFGDWDRPARWGPYGRRGLDDSGSNTWFRSDDLGEPQLHEPAASYEPPAQESPAQERPAQESDSYEIPRSHESPQSYEWSGTLESPAEHDGSSKGPAQDRTTSGTESSEGADSSGTQRFSSSDAHDSGAAAATAAESDGSAGEPVDSAGKDEAKSARLRSLFEPAVLPDFQEPSYQEPSYQEAGYQEPGEQIAGARNDADQHREAAPREEATQQLPRIEGKSQDEDEPRAEDETGTGEQGAPPPNDDPGAGPSSEVRNVDGSLRAAASPADFGGGAGALIKAHFASQQYHTPESPQYDRIAAEAWFRTASDAEQAGFEPWDGHPRAVQN